MTNGPHNLQLIGYVTPTNAPPPTPDGSDQVILEAPPVSITVSNGTSFPDARFLLMTPTTRECMSRCGLPIPMRSGGLIFTASTMTTSGTLGGQTTSGLIPVAWNLLDPHGRLRTDFISRPGLDHSVDTQALGGGGHVYAVGQKVWRRNDDLPSQGDCGVVNQQAWQGWNNADLLDQKEHAIASGASGAGFNVSPAGAYGEAFRIPVTGNVRNNAWQDVLQRDYQLQLPESLLPGAWRQQHVGEGYTPAGNGNGISATELGFGLRKIPWYAGLFGHPPQPNPQRYRFVFIDGCEGASYSGLPFLFGADL